MLLLNATTKSLEVKLGGAVTTNELTFVASWVDIDQSTIAITAMAEEDGVTAGATAVSVVAAPGASTTRQVKGLAVQNTDTVTQTVTVQVNNNGTKRPLIVQALSAGQTLLYDEENGWTIAPIATTAGATGATGATGAVGAAGLPGPPGDSGGDGDGDLWPVSRNLQDGSITLSDSTANDVSTNRHGFAPKAPNDATKFLNGVGAYAVPPSSGFTYVAKTTTYTAVGQDRVVCTSGTFTVTLPAASSNLNSQIWVANQGSGVITIGRTGSDTLGNQGETSQTLNKGDSMIFASDGVSVWGL